MKTKAHTKYTTSDGKRVQSVTTLINGHLGWNKGILIAWARSQGMKGQDPTLVMNEAAEIGTLAHLLCENYIKEEETDLDDYSKNQIKAAELCFEAFKEWDSQFKPEYVESEIKLIDDDLRVGGTCDLILKIDGKLYIGDLKSSKGLYSEFIVQLAAYRHMYEKQTGNKLEGGRLLRLDKTGQGFEDHAIPLSRLDWGWKVFEHILALADLRRDEQSSH
tara:strand:- start:349 stop:1005 length:657 start_codon:yes stop_codon:yes gene_type:complete